MSGRFAFKKKQRLLKNGEFAKTRKKGKKIVLKNFRIFVLTNNLSRERLGVSISKRLCNAARRNRVKRLIREFFRHNREKFPKSSDILITVADAKPLIQLRDIETGLSGFFKKAS